jgi:iron complex outermembrane receptor protein
VSGSTPTAWPAPLDRRINLIAQDVTLQQALDRVAESGGVRLSYSGELLPRDRRVCLTRQSVSIGEILTTLLAGTDLDPLAVGGDQIVLRRRPARERAPASTDSVHQVQELVPVVVTGIADDERTHTLGSSTTVIDGDELAQRNIRTLSDLFDGSVPGVFTWTQPPSAFLARYGSSRGASSFGASSPKTYIDGVEVANPLLVTMLDPEHIERIELIRGPQGAALYGSDALSGVVSITTRHEGSTDGRLDLRVRSSGGVVESRYSAQPLLTQSHSLTLRAGSPFRSFALAAAGDEIGSYLPGSRSRQLTALATGRLIGSRATLGLTARLASADASSPLSSLLSGTGEVVPTTLDSITSTSLRQYTVGLNTQLLATGDWKHTFVAGIDGYRLTGPGTDGSSLLRSTTVDAASIELPAGADRISLRTSSVLRLGDTDRAATTLTFGAEHTVLRQMSEMWTTAGAPLAAPVGSKSSPANPATAMAQLRSNTGVTAQLDASIDDHLFLTGGLRLERIAGGDALARLVALPMLGAGVIGHHGDLTVKLRGAYGKGVRAPRSATALASGHRDMMMSILIPEEQRGTEAAMEMYFGRALSLQVTRFDQLASGLAQRVSLASRSGRGGGMQLQNVGEITNRGWELEQSLKLGALSLGSSLSLVDSRVRAVAGGYQGELRAGDRMLDVPALTAGMTVGYQLRRTSATIGVSHARDWISYDILALQSAESPVSGSALRDYWRKYDGVTRLRASLSRDLGRGLRLMLSGDNLLDVQRGAPDNATILPGRTTTLTLRASF